jgi:hypothetical protein
MSYDSNQDTEAHIARVRGLISTTVENLQRRAHYHDASKLGAVEKPIFDKMTPLLKGSTYGSDEYRAMLAEMKPALDNHYRENRHHPEHHASGVDGMTLIDLLEMLCDWKAAGERHANGSIVASLKHNKVRFLISEQLAGVLENTAKELGWITE